MHQSLNRLLGSFDQDSDGIYTAPMSACSSDQKVELALRERVAGQYYDNYLAVIAQSHSIPVMDHEVDRFLSFMPRQALILDIGGCWGWHWRRLATRPHVAVLIIDFVRANLCHARNVLGSLVGTQIALMHADATTLPFRDAITDSAGFDGVWTVQVFQHIPNFSRACSEAHRVLKQGGRFVNYSLHATPLNRAIYWLSRRSFHKSGLIDNVFHLERACDRQREIVGNIFGRRDRVTERFTECLFHPDLKVNFTGRPGSSIGQLDARLSDAPWLGRWIARQRSFETVKA